MWPHIAERHLSEGTAVCKLNFLELALAGVQDLLDQDAPQQVFLQLLLELRQIKWFN